MANICRTELTIVATPEAINYFKEKFNNSHSGDYPSKLSKPHIIDVFGSRRTENIVDKIGAKWISIYDELEEISETECKVQLESAYHIPSSMISEIYLQLEEIDGSVKMYGRYWDEGFFPIGVFELYYGDIFEEEENVDEEDYELGVDGSIWEVAIEPMFKKLQKKLNKVMKEI